MTVSVFTAEEGQALHEALQKALARIDRLEAAQPEWLREPEAQQYTGLSQATLARARKKPDTLLVWKTEGGLRYQRSSLDAFNEARLTRRAPTQLAAA
ncbi:MAG: hypothetical protein ACRYFK_14480 [Janthinobacterium lividum]